MEIVSEGSLESISRPGSCDSVRASRDTKKHGQTMGFLEELPPEVVSLSFDEDVESEDDLIISPVENDVIIEDIYEGSTATQRSVANEDIGEGVNLSQESPSQKSGDVVKHTLSEDECCVETEIDPKIKKGLEKIRKLDAILAEKLKKEKDVKTFRKQLEKRWREEISQLDQIREKEGHGKIELSVGHALALGPPTDNDQPDESVSVPFTPVFATQPGLVHSERDNILSPSGRETNSSCDSWAEQDIDEVESKSTKRMRKRKGNRSNMKEKEQNFVKRNIELAADAGSVIPMTEAEKKRLEELLSDETDLFMIENAYVEGLALPEGEGYTLDTESLASLAEIDSKLQELVPQEEMDLLASQESWKTIADSRHSSHDSASGKDVENLGLGERILREDKEMREMKRKLLAIEADLQSLYRENNNESEVSLSDEILAKLIGGSSRTTSRSTTVSESVISALSTCRTDEQMPQHTPAAILDSETCETRPESVQSTSTLVRSEDMEGRSNSQGT